MKIEITIKGETQTARLVVNGTRYQDGESETEISITREEARRLLCAALDWRMCGWKNVGGFTAADMIEAQTGRRVYLTFPRSGLDSGRAVASTLDMFYECARDPRAVLFTANA